MTKVSPMIFNDAILRRFKVLIREERLAHAYLFIGPVGIGKFETALEVAKLVNCEQLSNGMPCGTCGACIKISSGNHPDIHVIDSSRNEAIKIEQIRGIINSMQLKAYEASRKVVILRNIENLTPESGNALLKTLEEPPANSLLLLTTSVPEKNLDTIKSRCHAVHFFSASYEALEVQLAKEYSIKGSEAHFLAYYAEGFPQRARRFLEKGVLKQKNEILDKLVLSTNSDAYLKKVLSDKEKTKEVLDVLYSWFHDLVLLKAGAGEAQVVHQDRATELRVWTGKYTFQELQGILDEIVKTARLLDENLNIKIPLNIIKEKLWRK